jgi:hypothetical protein
VRIFPEIRVHLHLRRRTVAARRPPLHGSSSTTLQSVPLLDLSQAVRAASSVENLYESITSMVRQAFSANAVSLFIREDETGDFACRTSTVPSHRSEEDKTGDVVLGPPIRLIFHSPAPQLEFTAPGGRR